MSEIVIRHPELSENPPSRLHDEIGRQLSAATGQQWLFVKLSGAWLVFQGDARPAVVNRRGKLSTALSLAVGRPVRFVTE